VTWSASSATETIRGAEPMTRLVGSDQRVAGELDGEIADPAFCPEYTHALAFPQRTVVEQALPRGARSATAAALRSQQSDAARL
jgi:hypothetical protein